MNADSKPEGPLRKRIREATRRAILEAAEATFGERGIFAARMEDVALRAGVAVGTVYNYFADKSALLDALLGAYKEELFERLDSSTERAAGQPFAARLEIWVRAVIDHFEAHRLFFTVAIEEDVGRVRGFREQSTTFRELTRRAADLVRAGIDERVLREDDAELFPDLLVGALRGALAGPLYAGSREPLAPRTHAVVRFFLRGAAP